jgi:hypothetical protein
MIDGLAQIAKKKINNILFAGELQRFATYKFVFSLCFPGFHKLCTSGASIKTLSLAPDSSNLGAKVIDADENVKSHAKSLI